MDIDKLKNLIDEYKDGNKTHKQKVIKNMLNLNTVEAIDKVFEIAHDSSDALQIDAIISLINTKNKKYIKYVSNLLCTIDMEKDGLNKVYKTIKKN